MTHKQTCIKAEFKTEFADLATIDEIVVELLFSDNLPIADLSKDEHSELIHDISDVFWEENKLLQYYKEQV